MGFALPGGWKTNSLPSSECTGRPTSGKSGKRQAAKGEEWTPPFIIVSCPIWRGADYSCPYILLKKQSNKQDDAHQRLQADPILGQLCFWSSNCPSDRIRSLFASKHWPERTGVHTPMLQAYYYGKQRAGEGETAHDRRVE